MLHYIIGFENFLSFSWYIEPQTPLIIDLTDLTEPRARKMKYLTLVRDKVLCAELNDSQRLLSYLNVLLGAIYSLPLRVKSSIRTMRPSIWAEYMRASFFTGIRPPLKSVGVKANRWNHLSPHRPSVPEGPEDPSATHRDRTKSCPARAQPGSRYHYQHPPHHRPLSQTLVRSGLHAGRRFSIFHCVAASLVPEQP